MHRLFVGLRPPREMRDALLAAMGGIEGARWQSDEQLHVTLRFVGEVERPVAEDIALALENVHAPALDLAVAEVGRFSSRGRANAVWAGIHPHDAVAALHRKVDQALIRIGLPPESRAYLPHITLARLGSGSGPTDGFLARHAGLTIPAGRFAHMTLYESHLDRDGARYETVARYPLVDRR